MTKKLTAKQQRFIEEYMVDLNATQAAIRANYSKKTAQRTGSENLSKPLIIAEIVKKRNKLTFKAEISRERVLKEEICLAMVDSGELFDPDGCLIAPKDLPEYVRRAISSIEVKEIGIDPETGEMRRQYKYKLWDKGRSIERLEKHLGLFQADNEQGGQSDLAALLTRIASAGPYRPLAAPPVQIEGAEVQDGEVGPVGSGVESEGKDI